MDRQGYETETDAGTERNRDGTAVQRPQSRVGELGPEQTKQPGVAQFLGEWPEFYEQRARHSVRDSSRPRARAAARIAKFPGPGVPDLAQPAVAGRNPASAVDARPPAGCFGLGP